MSEMIPGDDGLSAVEVGAWIKQKHDLLRYYIDISRATRKMFLTGKSKSATLIDLFCGPGRAWVKENREWTDGSTIAAWKISKQGGAPFSKIYFADIDHHRRQANSERLTRLNAPLREIPGSAVEAAAWLAENIEPHGLHFAFLDPYNLGALDFKILESLAKIKRIDILVHLSIMDLQRNLPQIY